MKHLVLILAMCAALAAQVSNVGKIANIGLVQLGNKVFLETTSVKPAYSGVAYSQSMTSTGGSGAYNYSVISGALPTGISLSGTGIISGSSTSVGNYSFSIKAADSAPSTPGEVYSMTRSYFMNVWPVLDTYGGINSVTISGCTPGYFQIKQKGTHWIWADPLCHAFVERSVYNVQGYIDPKTYCNTAPSSCVTNKFGGNYINWYTNILHIFSQIGINNLDIYSRTPAPTPFPYALFWNTLGDLYNGNRDCPNKILPNDTTCGATSTPAPLFVCDGQNTHGYNHCGSGYLTYDVFNPNYALASYNGVSDGTHIDELYLMKTNHSGFNTDPYILYISLGDATYLDALTGPGVPAISGASNYPDPAALVAMSNFSFHETGNFACSSGSSNASCGWVGFGFPTGVTQDLWSKYAWTCGKVGVDFGWGVGVSYLQSVYANIAALNAAWGSSYTTFCDSGGWGTGTGVLDEDGTGSWFASDGSNNNPAVYSQVGMNANLKADLAAFLQKFAYQAYYTQLNAVKQYDTNHMIGVGSYGGAGDGGVRTAVTKGVTQAGIDFWIWNWNNIYPSQAAAVDIAEYNDTCAAGKCTPGSVWYGISAVGDSSFYLCWNHTSVDGWGSCTGTGADASCSGAGGLCTGTDPGHGGQESRGALYVRDMPTMWNSTGGDGKQWNLGTVWWEYSDNSSEGNNWGLVSYQSNPYNGNSATTLGGIDAWGQAEGEFSDTAQSGTYVYTNPPVGYGNLLESIAATNLSIMQLEIP